MPARDPWRSAALHAASAIPADFDRSGLLTLPPRPWQRGTLAVGLPPPGSGAPMTLDAAIQNRVSQRAFCSQAQLPLASLGELLCRSCGLTRLAAAGADLSSHRATPSAGAVYPVQAFVVVSRVGSLGPGVYRYDAGTHALFLIRPGAYLPLLARALLDQPYVRHASVIVALVGMPGSLEERYGDRAYRYLLFEGGHIAQNLLLNATARHLHSLAIGGFVDRAVNHLLGLDGWHALTLSLVALGTAPAPQEPT